jgi:ABC-type thiamine transport system substrate-binding protein
VAFIAGSWPMGDPSRMNAKHIAAFVAATALSIAAFAGTTTQKPKITMAQARAVALKKAPGHVKSAELEKEHGKLIYSFDIATSKSAITEVNVDAMNGKIVAAQQESAAKEAAEKKHEAKH